MSSEKLFVDSSTIIYGIEYPKSNSALVLRLIRDRKISAATSQKVLEEVKNFLTLKHGENFAFRTQNFMAQNFKIVPRNEIKHELLQFEGKIKEKDLEHLATAKKLGLKIIAFDRDFKPFKEYMTPKELVQKLGLKGFDTDY